MSNKIIYSNITGKWKQCVCVCGKERKVKRDRRRASQCRIREA